MRIAKTENIKEKGKAHDRFQLRGVIVNKCENDSYIVKTENNDLIKKSHMHLKKIEVIDSETPSCAEEVRYLY